MSDEDETMEWRSVREVGLEDLAGMLKALRYDYGGVEFRLAIPKRGTGMRSILWVYSGWSCRQSINSFLVGWNSGRNHT